MSKGLELKPKNWFTTRLPQPNKSKNQISQSKMEEWLGDYTHPYYSPLKPLFTSEIADPEMIKDYEIVTLRDGLVPLLWFFRTNPDPSIFSNHFLVHHSLKQFIPQAWKSHIHYYSISSNKKNTPPTKIILTGHIPDQYCSQERIGNLITTLKLQIDKLKLNFTSADIYMPVLHDPFYIDVQGGSNLFYFCQEILTMFKQFGKIWTSRDFHSKTEFSAYCLFDIGSNMLNCDPSIIQQALGKNAMLLNPSPSEKPTFQSALSPYHQINIYQEKDVSTQDSQGDHLLKTFNEFYSIDHHDDKTTIGPFDKQMPNPIHMAFPNSFFRFVADNYK